MTHYYEVVAKCGHVGRDFYYEGHFFLKSSSKSAAAQYVKGFPRVKSDHKDAILWVDEICEQEYLIGQEDFFNNPYFNCCSKKEQYAVWDQIQDGIRPETSIQYESRKTIKYYKDKQKREKNKKGVVRHPYQYARANNQDTLKQYIA